MPDNTSLQDPIRVTINGYTKNSNFQFQILDIWPGLYGSFYLVVKEPNEVMVEMLNHFAMWGGPTKQDDEGNPVWEVSEERREWWKTFIERTQFYRPKDKVSL